MDAITLTPKLLEDLFSRHSLNFFTGGIYNVNLFGVRSRTTHPNKFDDIICMAFYTEAGWTTMAFPATTDPGSTVLGEDKEGSPNGTAILPSSTVNDQYKFQIGKHKGRYSALVQAEPFTVVRDANKDGRLLSREEIIERFKAGDVWTGYFGINMHHASSNGVSKWINDWSWGCQVFQSIFDWEKASAIIKRSSEIYGSRFTYTLFDEEDIEQEFGININDFYIWMNSTRSM